MTLTAEDIVARLKAGASPSDVIDELNPADVNALLDRCAIVRTFDEGVLDVLRKGPDDDPDDRLDATLEDLRGRGLTAAVPGSPGTYRLRPEVRASHAPRLAGDKRVRVRMPAALTRLSARLAEHYEARDEPVEALYHRFAASPARAVRDFKALYKAADAEFNLALCHDLLEVFSERLVLAGTRYSALLDKYEAYLDARGQWIDDWYRTARFTRPASSRKALKAFVAGTNPTLNLWARGGMGKTMHLRWLIARMCVPEPARIACARVDFDAVDASIAAREPWLLLVEVAAQLNRQFAGGPFLELVKHSGRYREWLQVRPQTASGDEVSALPSITPAAADEVREAFMAAVIELGSTAPILIVLDTLEVALLLGDANREQTDFEPLLKEFAAVQEEASWVRLAFAGRYDLEERVPLFRSLFPGAATLELTGLTVREATKYLTEHRGIHGDVAGAAVQSARAVEHDRKVVPLKLAIIADVVEDNPYLTADDIAGYKDADLLYLMERVLARIEEPVRWLLRYGVVPRTLDAEFVREVMPKHLRNGMSGVTDDPEHDPRPVRRGRRNDPLFVRRVLGPDEPLDVEGAWQQLNRYAGRASWVSVETGDIDAVRFHPDVVHPMRRLIADFDVTRELHRDAVEHFEHKAVSDIAHEARWAREAVYHRFQLEGAPAAAYWRARLDTARETGRAELRRQLAEEVLGSDYVENHRPRIGRDDKLVIDEETLVEARLELAVAAAQVSCEQRQPASSPAWRQAERALADVDYLASGTAPRADPARLAVVRAIISLGAGDLAGAAPELAWALSEQAQVAPADREWLESAYADALAATGRPDAEEHYLAALRIADERDAPPARRGELYSRLARHLEQRDALDRAAEAFDEALAITGDPELALERAAVSVWLGVASEAVAFASRVLDQPGHAGVRARIQLARSEMARGRASEAHAWISEAVGAAAKSSDPALSAEAYQVRADIHADLLDVRGALRDLDAAGGLWNQAGSLEGLCRVHLRRAAIGLGILGSLREAEVALEHLERARPATASPIWSDWMLLRAEFAQASGDLGQARHFVDVTIESLRAARRPPRQLVAAGLAGMTLGGDAVDRYLALVVEQLALVSPPRARLCLLEPLSRCPVLEGADPAALARLRELVPSPIRTPEAFAGLMPEDAAWLSLRDAELDRVVGDARGAGEALEVLSGEVLPAAPVAPPVSLDLAGLVMPIISAAVRAGAKALARRLAEYAADERRRSPSSPLLDAAFQVVAVEQAVEDEGIGDRGRQRLEDAGALLEAAELGGGRWAARIWELLAEDASRRAADGEARELRLRAAALYDALDDTAARERVVHGIESVADAPAPQEEVLVTVRSAEEELRVEVRRAHERTVIQGTPPPRLAFAAAAGALGAKEAILLPRTLTAELREFVAEMEDTLRAAAGEEAASDPGKPLALRLKPPALKQLPWELGWRPGGVPGALYRRAPRTQGEPNDVRSVQAALNLLLDTSLQVDGILGPGTREALDAFARETGREPGPDADRQTPELLLGALAGGRRPRVAVLRPTWTVERATHRGTRRAGMPIELMYDSLGFDPMVFEDRPAEELAAVLAERPVAVVHITAGLVDVLGTPSLDLRGGAIAMGSGAFKGVGHEPLLSTALDGLLPQDLPTPLVILDVPAPRSSRETAAQLLLRNAFASQLSELGRLRAVIAIGLASPDDQQRAHEALLLELAGGGTVAEATMAVRRLATGEDHAERLFAFGAAALWARTPDLRAAAPEG